MTNCAVDCECVALQNELAEKERKLEAAVWLLRRTHKTHKLFLDCHYGDLRPEQFTLYNLTRDFLADNGGTEDD